VRQIIDRRRLFERFKALVVGGICPAWVGGLFMTEASAAEQSERLPAFEFLGHHIGDRVQEKFSYGSQDDSKGEPYCSDDTSERITCHGDLKIWSGSGYSVGGVSVDLRYGFLNGKLKSANSAGATDGCRT
jgi:hypothetical protein